MIHKNVFRKSLVIGIIVLFVGAGFPPIKVIGDQPPETEWNKTFGGTD
jgi:hypothetical protein